MAVPVASALVESAGCSGIEAIRRGALVDSANVTVSLVLRSDLRRRLCERLEAGSGRVFSGCSAVLERATACQPSGASVTHAETSYELNRGLAELYWARLSYSSASLNVSLIGGRGEGCPGTDRWGRGRCGDTQGRRLPVRRDFPEIGSITSSRELWTTRD